MERKTKASTVGEAKKFLSEDHMCFESQSQVSEFPQVFVYLTLEKEASMIEEHVAGQSGFEQLRAMLSAFQSDLFNPHSALRGRGYYHPTLQARTLKHRGQVATQLISSTARICTPPLKSGHLTIGLHCFMLLPPSRMGRKARPKKILPLGREPCL